MVIWGIQSFRTHGSFVPRRFVPRLRSFVATFDQFVPNPMDVSYPTNYDTKCLTQTNIYFIYPSNHKTIKMHARTRKVYVWSYFLDCWTLLNNKSPSGPPKVTKQVSMIDKEGFQQWQLTKQNHFLEQIVSFIKRKKRKRTHLSRIK